jgi:hypothetical protein
MSDTEIFRFVKHADKDYWEQQGWIPTTKLEGTHHGEHAVLMQWPKDQESPPQET